MSHNQATDVVTGPVRAVTDGTADLSAPGDHAAPADPALVIDPEALDPTPPHGVAATVHRRRRRWPLVLLALVVVLGGYYAITLFQVWRVGKSDQARSVDAIVVMGAAQYDGRPSPQLQARLDHVVDLWADGLAPIVVVTGGNKPGDRFTEASASAAYLEEHGVDSSAILQENQGHSSWESLSTVAALLDERGLNSVLLVSDPYHSLRIRLIAEELGLAAYVSPTRTSPVTGATAFGKEMKEAGGVAIGRIIGFGRLLSITG